MIAYTVNESPRSAAALRAAGWRVLITPTHPQRPDGFRFAIDNDAWHCHQAGMPFDAPPFMGLVERFGCLADFVVVPDIVGGGRRSLDFSVSWLEKLRGLRRLLLPVQDGMPAELVGDVLRQHRDLGLFLGGSTEWKLKTMYQWGMVACSARRYYHVARVNSMRRVRLAAEAGADSFDGSGAAIFPNVNLGRLQAARLQPSLLVPSMAP
jgi:hypothetical protein